MRRTSTWKLAAAAGLATGTVVLAGLGVAGLAGAGGPMRFASAHDQKAYDLLSRSSAPRDLDAAAAEVSRALDLSPYSNSARLRLTYIDTVRRRGSLGPVGLAHLERSYDLVPLDHTVAAWRVRFALEHWPELPPELRRAVGAEALAFGGTGSRDADVRAALVSIRNPEGRLAAALWIRALDYRPRVQRPGRL